MVHPQLLQTVLDATDVRRLAEFYRELLDLVYRPGDEPPSDGADEADWLVLTDRNGARRLAFQAVAELARTTWPDPAVPQQLHIDMTVADLAELHEARASAERLGARLVLDRSADPEEALYVLVDPEGHPFCLFVPS